MNAASGLPEAQLGVGPAGAMERAGVRLDPNRDLDGWLERGLEVGGAAQTAARFLPLLAAPERGVQAVLLYGSLLWRDVRGQNSQPDFIVVVDSLERWHQRFGDLMMGAILPPSVYRLRRDGAQAKLSVVTAGQLAEQTGPRAKDLHLAGRLSKRVALVWARDPAARTALRQAQRAALQTMARLALSRFGGDVGLDDFLMVLLGLSYESELRIVEPGKVAKLLEAEREHYRGVGRALLRSLGAAPADAAETRFVRRHASAATPAETRRQLRRSRRRAYLRWPKYLATYDGWLEYLLQKLARAGSPVSLSERQRRHPLIFALPVLYRMARTHRLG